jgi:hypothetical protein
MQAEAVEAYLRERRAAHLVDLRAWQQALRVYEDAVRMDDLRICLLEEAGIRNVSRQVR